jgi:hypothetical protein
MRDYVLLQAQEAVDRYKRAIDMWAGDKIISGQ